MKVTPHRFLFIGNGPCVNHGCEAILRGTMRILEKALGKCDFVSCPVGAYSDSDPSIVAAPNLRHSTEQYPYGRFTFLRLQQSLLRRVCGTDYNPSLRFSPFLNLCSMAIALGGDNFSLDYGSPRYQFEILAHAREKGVPTAIWGASIGPFDRSPDDLKLAKEELPKASLITVRESISRDYLASMGITDNVKLVADPAFVLPAREVELPASVTDALETGCVGVNISPLLGTYLSTGEDWLDLTAALLKAVDDASDVPVILIPHVVRSQKNDNDWEFMHQALRRLGAARNAFFELPAALNACELKWVISKLTAFVGARTHATIAALSSQIPTLSLGYSVKAEGINKDIFGHTDWVLPLGNITPGSLKEQTQALLGSQKAVRQHLQETMPRYTKLAWDGGRHVAEFMRDGHIS